MLSPAGWGLAVTPIDLDCGTDQLLVKVQTQLGRRAQEVGACVFRNRASTRIKLLCVDAQSVWLCVRRLNEGSFVRPHSSDAICTFSPEQFYWLSAGMDWQRLSMHIEGLPKAV